MEKNSSNLGAINSWNKTQHISVMCHLKHSAQPKLKVHFLKNALENINEKVKDGNFNYGNKSIIFFLTIYNQI